ncbi:hypothetical protein D3C85_1399180 [compost metagenome]
MLHRFTLVSRQCNQTAGRQHFAPMGTVHRFQQLRRQQHHATLLITFRWQRQGEVRLFECLEQIKTDVAVTQLVTGQRSRQ